MDIIKIENLVLFANHGLYPEEKTLGQKFSLDISLYLDTQYPGITKDLDHSVDYGTLIGEIKDLFRRKSVDLLETLAEDLASYILDTRDQVEEVEVTICKPWAPVMTQLDTICVHVRRKRNLAYLGLGSNMGESKDILDEALELLGEKSHTKIKERSSIIQTEAWGMEDQDDFLNMVVEIQTSLKADNLLKFTQSIEDKLGRTRSVKWGPRLIDIDILFYNDEIIYTKDLIVPHPYIEERDFVLGPMEEIAPFFIHPVLNKQIRVLNKDLKDKS